MPVLISEQEVSCVKLYHKIHLMLYLRDANTNCSSGPTPTSQSLLEHVLHSLQHRDILTVPVCQSGKEPGQHFFASPCSQSLNHGLLLGYLSGVGLENTALQWLWSFLEWGAQKTTLGESCSTPRDFTCGIL